MARIEPSASDKRLVLERFERTCAVCGTKDASDTAHLYEDATERRATSGQLIVLCPTHNQAQMRAHGNFAKDLPSSFDPSLLSAQASTALQDGHYPLSYAKARLAAYLFEEKTLYSEAVECLTQAISAIRAIRWGDWLAATVLEVERLCGGRLVGPATRWLFLDRFALVLFDYCRWDESINVLSASMQLLNSVASDPYNPQRRDFDLINSFRRQSLIQAFTQRLDRTQSISAVLDKLEEGAHEFARAGHYDAFATHLDVARKLAWEVEGDIEKAHRYSEIALSKESKVRHKWVLQEHVVSEVAYFYLKKDSKKALELVFKAFRMYGEHPVVLEPVLESAGPRRHSIHQDLSRFGITIEELLANGVTIRPPTLEVALDLTPLDVARIVLNTSKP